jgi:hypothetical protein
MLTAHQIMAIASIGWNDTSTFSLHQPICDVMGYGWSGDKFTIENAIPVSETVREKVMAEGQYWLGK